jgi:murein L,D-transpeptidase YcbB/YkuD
MVRPLVTIFLWQAVLLLGLESAIASADPAGALLQKSLQPQLHRGSRLHVNVQQMPQGVAEFYAARQWAPVWDDARFAVLLKEIAGLDADGLNPEDYGLAALKPFAHVGDDPVRQAQREKMATRAYLLALVHLYRGKVDPVQVDPHWNFAMRPLDPEHGLMLAREAVENNKIDEMFQAARPTLPQYKALRAALATLRQTAASGGWPRIPAGPALKPGMSDARVPVLRKRMAVPGMPAAAQTSGAPDLYDPQLVGAVQRFQADSYAETDGVLGPATVRALDIPVQRRIGQLRVNLERMRWIVGHLDQDYVLVDVAGYHVFYIHDNKPVWQARIQIGKSYRQTPVFRSYITRVTLNPTWTVPPTIMRKDSLPAIRRSREYLSKNNIRVFDARGHERAPESVNWRHPGHIILRQDAGPDNSLGQLVLRFPNPYDVYMHDTPHKSLFDASQRAFSSGCIRVQNVRDLAVILLADPVKWSKQALDTTLATNITSEVKLPKKIPVLIAYWTFDMDDSGYVSFKPDVYGEDPKILKALDGPSTVAIP